MRYRDNGLVKEFVEKAKLKSPRYLVNLCQRIMSSQRHIPEDIIMDAIGHMIKNNSYYMLDYMGYLEYRGYGSLCFKFGDRARDRYIIKASQIAQVYSDE